MDWDEPQKQKAAATLGEDLAALSIEDLEQRITELKAEITRVEAEIDKRKGQKSAADAVFGS